MFFCRHISFALATLALPFYLFAQTTRPALDQLNREMQALYHDVQAQTVRVQIPLPTTQQVVQADHPLIKWGPKLDPTVLARLQSGTPVRIYIQQNELSGATQMSSGQIRIEQLSADANLIPITPPRITSVECIGIILDERGHVMMPAYVNRETVADKHLQVLIGQRQVVGAKFVASDQPTNTTIVQLDEPAGKPAIFADTKPNVGEMVLMMYPGRSDVRMELWTGGRDQFAIVVGTDGRIGGVLQRGHMIVPGALRPVIAQLIETGIVRRPLVGFSAAEVPAEDPARESALGTRAALRVTKVIDNSPAAAAGITRGDLILSMAGEAVEDVPGFAAAITAKRGKTELKILRNTHEMSKFIDLQP